MNTLEQPLDMHVITDDGPAPVTLYSRRPWGDAELTGMLHTDAAAQTWTGPTVTESLAPRPFRIAWRCGGTTWPEFSQQGIEGSIAAGYTLLEVSVNRCATGEFVCSHDTTTDRVTGSSFTIRDTPWATIAGLSNQGAPLLRLPDALDLIGDRAAVAIDHKPSSWGSTDPVDISEEALLIQLLGQYPGGRDRFLWKTFGGGVQSRNRAKTALGLQTMSMWYESEVGDPTWTEFIGQEDIIGMEYTASQANWDTTKAVGRPTIAHICQTTSDVTTALARGADGLMCGIPDQVHP